MDMSKYKGMFIDESREHLKNINELLMVLEKTPNSQSSISTLFREYHSLKGMAASMGYKAIQEISHSMEDLLDVIRKRDIPVPPFSLSLLFSGTDLLETMVEETAADRDISNPGSEILARIRLAESELKGEPFPEDSKTVQDQDSLLDAAMMGDLDEEIVAGELVASSEQGASEELEEPSQGDSFPEDGGRQKKKKNRKPSSQ
jgi:two-component system, chemotaxis family, sensor kinase CheA